MKPQPTVLGEGPPLFVLPGGPGFGSEYLTVAPLPTSFASSFDPKLEWIEGVGHFPFLEAPEDFWKDRPGFSQPAWPRLNSPTPRATPTPS